MISEAIPELHVVDLTVEHEREPLGLGERTPRFSWKLHSTRDNVKQAAYRILVASDRSLLESESKTGDVWDSGRVESDQSVLIEYTGKELLSDADYYWTVCVWDGHGMSSGWSEIARWSMGLLDPSNWIAKWIALGEETGVNAVEMPGLDGASWIRLPEADRKQHPNGDVYAGKMVYFRATVNVSGRIRRALLTSTGDCRPLLFVNGQLVHAGYQFQYPVYIDLTEIFVTGRNVLAYCVNEEAGYGIGAPFGALCAKLRIETEEGETLEVATGPSWKVSEEKAPDWNALDCCDSGWLQAEQAGEFGSEPWGKSYNWMPKAYNPTRNENGCMRNSFRIDGEVRRAFIYATALGVYELQLNGRKVGEHELAPGWTDYKRRVMVQAYDVTSLLSAGENAIGIMVGPGWYAGCVAMFGAYQYGTRPFALAQLHIEYADGSREVLGTDEKWEWKPGPIRFSDLLMGETYDARESIPGWSSPDENTHDEGWQPVKVSAASPFEGRLTGQCGPAVKVMESFVPISMTEPQKGVFIFDLGQNIVGRVRVQASGPKGTEIRIRFAEMLTKEGHLYTESLRGARQTDVFILCGEGVETFEPRFTFHGFQYFEVTGYPGRPSPDSFTAFVLRSDTPSTGSLETDDPLINKLISNIEWGQKDNFLSVPTDCPQRDERLGWTGDAQIFIRTASFNMNVAGFFTKWMIDVEDAQWESGAFTNIAPHLGWIKAGIAAWGEAGIIVPWTVYRVYGDKRILERHYPAMERFMEFLKGTTKDWLRPNEGYGDWLSIGADTAKDLLATAYFAYTAKLMAEVANVLGKTDDSTKYHEWFRQIRQSFQTAYVGRDALIQGDTQTAYLLALIMDLLPQEQRHTAALHLVRDIESKGMHLSTGFVGVSYLLPVLSDHGFTDIAYGLLQQKTFPSWLYSVVQGATTMWERWDGWTIEHGPQKAVMNSFNHYSYGSVAEWMYRYMAGIDLPSDSGTVGYKKFIVKPRPGGSISRVKATYETVYGGIGVEWEKSGENHYRMQVIVPTNTEAEIWVPLGVRTSDIIELSGSSGLTFDGEREGYAVYHAGSGDYVFKLR